MRASPNSVDILTFNRRYPRLEKGRMDMQALRTGEILPPFKALLQVAAEGSNVVHCRGLPEAHFNILACVRLSDVAYMVVENKEARMFTSTHMVWVPVGK